VVGVLAVIAIYIGIENIPETSEVVVSETNCVSATDSEGCIRFPTITGQNLPGDDFTLPDDFEGDLVFVVIPFDQEQQVRADTWLPFAEELFERFAGLRYYNVPIFPELSGGGRLLARAGMNVAITDRTLREITITVFLDDRDLFLKGMDIPDVDDIRVFLLDRSGDVLWRGVGDFTTDQGNDLITLMESLS